MSKAENNQEFMSEINSRLLQRARIDVLKIMVEEFGLQPCQKTNYIQQASEALFGYKLDQLVQSINEQGIAFEYAYSPDCFLKSFYLEDFERTQLILELFRKPQFMTDEFRQVAVHFAVQTGRNLEDYLAGIQKQKVKSQADSFKQNEREATQLYGADPVSEDVAKFMLQVIESTQKKVEKAELEEPFKQVNHEITRQMMNKYAFLNILTFNDDKALSISLEAQAKVIRGGFENYFELVYDQLNYMSEKDLLQLADQYKRFLAEIDLKFLAALQEHQLTGKQPEAIEIKLPHLDDPTRIKALAKLNSLS